MVSISQKKRHLDWWGQKEACEEREMVVEMVLYIRLDACHELFIYH